MPLIQDLGSEQILVVEGLRTYFYTRRGVVRAVDGVSFGVKKREIFGLVGESGCGKSVTALSIMKLIPDPPGRIVAGKISLNGESITEKTEDEMCSIRGRRISMIFQDPLTSLNPVLKVGYQLAQTITTHQNVTDAWQKAEELLAIVGIPDARMRLHQYPFQMSGGMRQRVMIALALSCNPQLLIADEPTTNLDVTIQSQILELIKATKDSTGASVLLITHNLGIVAWLCDKVAVMYAGKVVEVADTFELFKNPLHPYTTALLHSIPSLDSKKGKLKTIEGEVPNLIVVPTGCRFHPRCPYAKDMCREEEPPLSEIGQGHLVSCFMQQLPEKW